MAAVQRQPFSAEAGGALSTHAQGIRARLGAAAGRSSAGGASGDHSPTVVVSSAVGEVGAAGLGQGKARVAPPERVQVVCRVRPSDEYASSCVSIKEAEGGDVIEVEGMQRTFAVTKAFGEDSAQADVYDYVGRPALDYILQGYGACIFAYGQTGSGKTFTMTGTPSSPGLTPRIVRGLFSSLSAEFADFTVACQYVEVYMEKVRDLLSPAPAARNPWDSRGPKIAVRFDSKRVQIDNAKRLTFGRGAIDGKNELQGAALADALTDRVLRDVEAAGRHRTVRSHQLNAESSRSHAVLILEVTARRSNQHIASTLMLVDLAGNENIGKAGVEGLGKEEAKSINKSLFSLTRCIEALANGQKVPFRDSTLTKILAPALGGQACCTLIAALRGEHPSETRETLKFTETALKVKVQPKQMSSEALGAVQEQARDMKTEIEALRQEIEWLKQSGQDSESLRAMIAEKIATLEAKESTLASLHREIGDTERQLSAVRHELDSSKREADRERQARERAEAENNLLRAQLKHAEKLRESERQALGAEAQARFESKTHIILQEFAKAESQTRFEEAMKLLVVLVRHFQEDLQGRLCSDSHHARRALNGDFHDLLVGLERCLREWPELHTRLTDLGFIVGGLQAQADGVDRMCDDAGAELTRYQAVLDEVRRLCRRASEVCFAGLEKAMVDSTADGRDGPLGLDALLLQVAGALSDAVVRWRRLSNVWSDHWLPKLRPALSAGEGNDGSKSDTVGDDDASASTGDDGDNGDVGVEVARAQTDGSSVEESVAALEVERVAVIARGLSSVFCVFQALVRDLLGFGSAADADLAESLAPKCVSSLVGVRVSCMRFLHVLAEREAEQPSGARARAIADECDAADLGEACCPTAVADACPRSLAVARHWSDVLAAISSGDEALEDSMSALARVQADRVCDIASVRRHLLTPSAAFVRDVAKLVRYDTPVFEGFDVLGFSWGEGWTACAPDVAVRNAFFQELCRVARTARERREWPTGDDAEAAAACALEGASAQGLRLFLVQLCLLVDADAADEADAAHGLRAHAARLASSIAAARAWAERLCELISGVVSDGRADAERRLLDSAQDMDELRGHVRALLAEREQHNSERQQWEEHRETLMQDLRNLQREKQALSEKLVGAEEAEQRGANEVTALKERLQREMEVAAEASTRLEEAEGQVAAVRDELASASGKISLNEEARNAIAEQSVVIGSILRMLKDVSETSWEAGRPVQDLMVGLEGVLRSQWDTLQSVIGSFDEAPSGEMGLQDVSSYISRAKRRIREAQIFAQGDPDSPSAGTEADLDESEPEVCKQMHQALLDVIRQRISGSALVRADEERRFMMYMRATMAELGRLLQDSSLATLDWSPMHRDMPAPILELKDEEAEAEAELFTELPFTHPEFRRLKAEVEGAGRDSRGVALSVQRIRRIHNPLLQERFQEGVACQLGDARASPTIRSVYHGTGARVCELIAEFGFRLPQELSAKGGHFGNAIYLANSAGSANTHCPATLGRLRSLLVCDVAPGRVLSPAAGVGPADEKGALPDMDFARLRALRVDNENVVGFDSVFVAGATAEADEYAVYDPRTVLPRYIVDFDVEGFGSERGPWELEEVERLRAEVERLRAEGGGARTDVIRERYRDLQAVFAAADFDARLVRVRRDQDPELWDRCAARLAHATAEGPGIPAGFEAVLTKLERVVNPALAADFYGRAAELLCPEEGFRLLLHGGGRTPEDRAEIVRKGLVKDLEADPGRFGVGMYFSTCAATLGRAAPGSQTLFLCEVALGKPMLAQASRPNLDLAAVERAGFDAVHAPRVVGDDAGSDEWVVYHAHQALPVYVLSYDVQPRAVAADLLKQMADMEEQRRLLDGQMAMALQALEDARRDADETRERLDASLARQLVDEDEHLAQARREHQFAAERLDREQARLLQEVLKRQAEGGGFST